jgi:hypothetical protein
MKAAWFLRSRQLRWSIRYWVVITGYDINDKSVSNRIYLFYLVIFLALWGLSVLALFTSTTAQILQSFPSLQPALASVKITSLVLLAWWLWKLYSAAQRCPIRFSAEDSVLICTTPTSRPAVVFSWIISEWFTNGIAFWGLAILLGFTLAEISLGRAPTWKDTPLYLGSGFHFLLPVFFTFTGMLAFVWGLGSFRLQKDRELRYLNLVPLGIGILFGPGILLLNSATNLSLSIASPLLVPVMAGGGLADYLPGVLISLAWMVLGGLSLYWASKEINLSRAAQETGALSTGVTSGPIRSPQLSDEMKLKKRLKSGSSPSQLAGWSNEPVILWKQIIRTLRSFSPGNLFDWVVIFGLSLGILVVSDWAARGVLLLFWINRVNERISKDFRADLEIWSLYQSLPFKPARRLFTEVFISAGIVVILGWVAFAFGKFWGAGIIPWQAFILLPFIVAIIAISGSNDILRQIRVENLLTGNIPLPGLLSLLLSVLTTGAIILIFLVFKNIFLSMLVSILISILISAGVLGLYKNSYQKLGR